MDRHHGPKVTVAASTPWSLETSSSSFCVPRSVLDLAANCQCTVSLLLHTINQTDIRFLTCFNLRPFFPTGDELLPLFTNRPCGRRTLPAPASRKGSIGGVAPLRMPWCVGASLSLLLVALMEKLSVSGLGDRSGPFWSANRVFIAGTKPTKPMKDTSGEVYVKINA